MKLNRAFSQHHIYRVNSDKIYDVFSFNSPINDSRKLNRLNIWQLMKGNRSFRVYWDLWRHENRDRPPYTNAGRSLISFLSVLEKGLEVKRLVLSKGLIFILSTSVGFYLKKLQTFFLEFEPLLTAQYKSIIRSMNFDLDKHDELIFHLCDFDCYVWVPAKTQYARKLLVIFLTKDNTLNMPLPIAHYILAKLGIALMYVDGKKNKRPDHFLAGRELHESAELILAISKDLGFEKLYGLGVSSGGFRVCKIAKLLGFKRVLNFSGAKRNKISETLLSMRSNFPQDRILSVLSKTDEGDKLIKTFYDQDNFNTKTEFLSSNSHGTFSAAYVEKKLPQYFNWLLAI